MTVNAFYSQHMRPGRPAGTSLDVKVSSRQKGKKSGEGGNQKGRCGQASSYKKLSAFASAMERDGLGSAPAPSLPLDPSCSLLGARGPLHDGNAKARRALALRLTLVSPPTRALSAPGSASSASERSAARQTRIATSAGGS